MTQAVYEKDLRKLGFRDGYGSGYEDAKFEYDSLLRKSEARYQKSEALRQKNEVQHRKSEALLLDRITQLEAALQKLSK